MWAGSLWKPHQTRQNQSDISQSEECVGGLSLEATPDATESIRYQPIRRVCGQALSGSHTRRDRINQISANQKSVWAGSLLKPHQMRQNQSDISQSEECVGGLSLQATPDATESIRYQPIRRVCGRALSGSHTRRDRINQISANQKSVWAGSLLKPHQTRQNQSDISQSEECVGGLSLEATPDATESIRYQPIRRVCGRALSASHT